MASEGRRLQHGPFVAGVLTFYLWNFAYGQNLIVSEPPSWISPSPADDDVFLTAYIGEEVGFEVQAKARGPFNEDPVELLQPWAVKLGVDEDPGLPNVAVVDGPRTTAEYFFLNNETDIRLDRPTFTARLSVSWVPTCVQTRDYNVHLTAQNIDNSLQKRFHLSVVAPSPELVGFDDTPLISRIGCPVNVSAVAREGSQVIRDAGYGSYGQVVTYSLSRTDLRGETRALSELAGLQFREVRGNEWGGSTGVVEWRPQRGQDGATYTICFLMQDECRTAGEARGCIEVAVVKCQRCLVAGESLESLAKEYQTDFLSLFSFNVAMPAPDALPEGRLVNLGLQYRARDQDSLHSIAQRFFLTVDAILAVNPDIELDVPDRQILQHDLLCLSPPLCSINCVAGTQCALHPSVAGV